MIGITESGVDCVRICKQYPYIFMPRFASEQAGGTTTGCCYPSS